MDVTITSENVTSLEDGNKFNWNFWLWVPYSLIGVACVFLLVLSFVRFHYTNRERYKQREIRKRSTLHHMNRQRSVVYHIKLPPPQITLMDEEIPADESSNSGSGSYSGLARGAWRRAVKMVRGGDEAPRTPKRPTLRQQQHLWGQSRQSSVTSQHDNDQRRGTYRGTNLLFLMANAARTKNDEHYYSRQRWGP